MAEVILRKESIPCSSRSAQPQRCDLGKGCIRYSNPDKIDFKIVEMMRNATRESTGVIRGHNEG